MAEIGPTASVSHWPSTLTVNSNHSGKNSAKQQQKQQRNTTSDDAELDSPDKGQLNPRKRPPDSGLNSHIDEYA